MTELMGIQGFIDRYAKAISDIIGKNIIIIDKEFVCVAGTGSFKKNVGEKMVGWALLEKAMQTKKSCLYHSSMGDFVGIAYPVFLNGAIAGALGASSYDKKSYENICQNFKKWETFITDMNRMLESENASHRLTKNIGYQLEAVVKMEKDIEKETCFVTQDERMLSLLTSINRISSCDLSVLITGERGIGKELLAKHIHEHSKRNEKLMVSVSCNAPEGVLESELFGIEERGLNDKELRKMGKLEIANHSTLFLDEIDAMPAPIQIRLLKAVKEGSFKRIGGKKPVTSDIRFICSCDRNLVKCVEEGSFNGELYSYLSNINMDIPPLRQRPDDIPLLIKYFINAYNVKLKKQVDGIMDEALQIMRLYSWPGNVRELKNAVEYLVNVVERDYIKVSDLPAGFSTEVLCKKGEETLPQMLKIYEKKIISEYLDDAKTADDRKKLALKLGISRATLYRKLAEYGFINHADENF